MIDRSKASTRDCIAPHTRAWDASSFEKDRDRGSKDWYGTNDKQLSQIAISWLGCIFQTLQIGQLELTPAVNVRQLWIVIPRKDGYRYELRSATAIAVRTGGGSWDVSPNGLAHARLQKHREPRLCRKAGIGRKFACGCMLQGL